MSVYQRSDGRWVCKVRDDTYTPPKWVQKTFKTKQEAEQHEDDWKADSRESSRLTVYEAVLLYLKDNDLSQNAQWQYKWLVAGSDAPTAKRKVGYAECIADKYVESLTRRDYEAVKDCARDGGCCNVTINQWLSRLKAVFNYAETEELIERNPWSTFRRLKAKHGSRKGTLDQFLRVYKCLPEWFQWACRTAMALFLRPGYCELFRLKWSAFDWTHGSVSVWMSKVSASKTVYPNREYMSEAWERFCADGRDADQYVCRNSRGQMVRDYSQAWRRALRKAGVKGFSFYALRHIVATTSLENGADVAAVAANLGHASPKTTLDSYAHAMPSAQKAASEALDAPWCSGELPEPVKTSS